MTGPRCRTGDGHHSRLAERIRGAAPTAGRGVRCRPWVAGRSAKPRSCRDLEVELRRRRREVAGVVSAGRYRLVTAPSSARRRMAALYCLMASPELHRQSVVPGQDAASPSAETA